MNEEATITPDELADSIFADLNPSKKEDGFSILADKIYDKLNSSHTTSEKVLSTTDLADRIYDEINRGDKIRETSPDAIADSIWDELNKQNKEIIPEEDENGENLVPQFAEEGKITLNIQELAENLKDGKKRQDIMDDLQVALGEKVTAQTIKDGIGRLEKALNDSRDVYSKYRVVFLFDEVKKALGESEFAEFMKNMGKNRGLTVELIEGFRDDAMRLDVDMKNRQAYINANKTGDTKELYNRVFARLPKDAEGKIDLEKASALDIYLASMISRHLAEETHDDGERQVITGISTVAGLDSSPRISAAVDQVREATKDLPEEIRNKLIELSLREAVTDEEKELKKKYAGILEVKPAVAESPTEIPQRSVEKLIEEMTDEEKFNALLNEMVELGRDIQIGKYDEAGAKFAKIYTLAMNLASQIASDKANGDLKSHGSKENLEALEEEVQNVVPEVLTGSKDSYDPKLYQRFRGDTVLTEAEIQKAEPDKEKEVLNKMINDVLKDLNVKNAPSVETEVNIDKLTIPETVLQANLLALKITDRESYEKYKLKFAELNLHLEDLMEKQGLKNDQKNDIKKQIEEPIVFGVDAMLSDEFDKYKNDVKFGLLKEEEPASIAAEQALPVDKRIENSRKWSRRGLIGGAVVAGGIILALIFAGRGQQVEAVKTTPTGQPPAGQTAPVGGVTTQGDVVGGVVFNSPREQAGYPNPNESALPSQNPTPAPQTNQEGETTPSTDMNKKVIMKITIGNKEGENVFPTWGHFNRYLAKTLGVDMPVGYQWGDQFGEVYDAESVAVTGKKSNIPGRQEAELEKTHWNDSFEITQDIVDIMKANLQKAGFLK